MLDTDHQVIAFPLSDRIAQNRLAQLDDVVAITASMVGVAELCDWEALTALQDQRDEMVQEALSEGLPGRLLKQHPKKSVLCYCKMTNY